MYKVIFFHTGRLIETFETLQAAYLVADLMIQKVVVYDDEGTIVYRNWQSSALLSSMGS